MSYVEQFCEDIVIINQGEVVLEGNLDEIKRSYGKDRLVLKDTERTVEEFSEYCKQQLSDVLTVNGQTKKAVIVKLAEGKTRRELLEKILAKNNLAC